VASVAPVAGLSLWFLMVAISYLATWNSDRTGVGVNATSADAP
jgi:hypothetical protein